MKDIISFEVMSFLFFKYRKGVYMAEQAEYEKNKDIIWQIGKTNKFLEFANNLTVANIDDYAQLTGRGGQNHAPNAVIQLIITTKGKPKVFANLEPYYFEMLREVALRNLGDNYIGTGETTALLSRFNFSIEICSKLLNSIHGGLCAVRNLCRGFYKGQSVRDSMTALGCELKNVMTSIESQSSDVSIQNLGLSTYSTWETKKPITRVNIYSVDSMGYAECKELTIRRQQYREVRGVRQESKEPWYFEIRNFKAKPLPPSQGIGYMANTVLQDSVKTAFINVNDEDMLEACSHILSFIRVWEIANCVGLVQQGCENKRIEWQIHQNARRQ